MKIPKTIPALKNQSIVSVMDFVGIAKGGLGVGQAVRKNIADVEYKNNRL